MANSVLDELAREYGMKVKGTCATDVVNRIPIRITMSQYARAAVACDQAYYNKIKSQIPGGFVTYQNGQAFFTISNGNPVNSYEKIRNMIKELFAEYYEDPACPYCHATCCDTAAFHQNLYVPVHSACYNKVIAGQKETSSKGNYFLGALLAFAGCLGLMMINVADILFSEKEYAVVYALAPMIGGCLYAWKGRRNIAGKIIATVSAFLGYALAMYIVLAGELAAARSIDFFEAATTRFVTIFAYVFDGFFLDNLFDIVMVVIGLVACFFVAGMDLNARNNESPDLARPLNV
ncbi:MAG: hypothetical protein J5776_02660 [Clostridiales bacterium]|nr:hypothetical protein [Clostridiales bacterium]